MYVFLYFNIITHACYIGYYSPMSVNIGSSHYRIEESDGSVKVTLVASRPSSFVFYIRLDVILNLHRFKGSLGMCFVHFRTSC